jgi:hypothetical protein
MPDMAIALIRAIIAAADQDRDEMTVLLIHGEPAALTRRRRPKHAWCSLTPGAEASA